MAEAVFPDVAIAGAPKCGTTSLFEWLAGHPGVSPSLTKETCFLMDRDSVLADRHGPGYHQAGPAGYAAFFGPAGPGTLRLEATPDYLYQDTASRVLAELPNRPKALFLFRKPSRRVFSAFRFFQGPLAVLDTDLTFSRFTDLILADPSAPEFKGHQLVMNIASYSRYAFWLKPWLERLGQDRVRAFLFEDLRRDPAGFTASVCADLGLDAEYFRNFDFSPRNISYKVRSSALQRLRNRLSANFPRGPVRSLLGRAYRSLNVSPSPMGGERRDDADTLAALARLDEYFHDDERELARIASLDIAPWRSM